MNSAHRHNRTPVRATLTAAVLMAMASPAVFAADCQGLLAGQIACFNATANGTNATAVGDGAAANGNYRRTRFTENH